MNAHSYFHSQLGVSNCSLIFAKSSDKCNFLRKRLFDSALLSNQPFKNHSSRVTSEMAAIPGSLVEAGRRSSSSNREGSKSFGRGGAGMA
jgi:hypothetical protein